LCAPSHPPCQCQPAALLCEAYFPDTKLRREVVRGAAALLCEAYFPDTKLRREVVRGAGWISFV